MRKPVVAVGLACGLAILLSTSTARACKGDLCLVLTNCARTLVMTKGTPLASTVTTFPGVWINVFLRCGTACGSACPNPPVSVSGTATVTLTPINPATNPVVTVTTNLAPIPSCSTAGANTAYLVRFSPIPAAGTYAVSGSASVTFNDGLTITARGDTMVCIQPDAPGQPGVPLLAVEPLGTLTNSPFVRLGPGDQNFFRYRVKNNGTQDVMLTAFATSRQRAVRPEGGSLADGVYAVADATGDDFPIAFWDPNPYCLPLPGHPYTQPEVAKRLPKLGPGQSTELSVVMRSWGQCASGSCSEGTLRVEGEWLADDGALQAASGQSNRRAEACAGFTLLADTSLPPGLCAQQPILTDPSARVVDPANWGRSVNDANNNGIPDALDIQSGRSQDRNFNAMPDEAEVIPGPNANPVTAYIYGPLWAGGAEHLRAHWLFPGYPLRILRLPGFDRPPNAFAGLEPGIYGLVLQFHVGVTQPGNRRWLTAAWGSETYLMDWLTGRRNLIARDSYPVETDGVSGDVFTSDGDGTREGANSLGQYDNQSERHYLRDRLGKVDRDLKPVFGFRDSYAYSSLEVEATFFASYDPDAPSGTEAWLRPVSDQEWQLDGAQNWASQLPAYRPADTDSFDEHLRAASGEYVRIETENSGSLRLENGRRLDLRAKSKVPAPGLFQWYSRRFGIPPAQAGLRAVSAPSWLDAFAPIPGATASTLEVVLDPWEADKEFCAVVTCPYGSVTSNVERVTQTFAPSLTALSAASVSGTNVSVRFDRPLDLTTATNPANYMVNGGSVAVVRAAFGLPDLDADGIFRADPRAVHLTLAAPVGSNFTVSASSNLRDARSHAYPGGSIEGRLWARSAVIGPLNFPGGAFVESVAPGAGRITTGGSGFIGPSDGGWFVHEERQGDFRVKVRMNTVWDFGNPFALAGLHVRETLAANSKSVLLALDSFSPFNPGAALPPFLPDFHNTITFRARYATGSGNVFVTSDTAPASVNRWLLLERTGHVFKASYSENGHDWVPLASDTITMSNRVLIGVAATPSSTIFFQSQVTTHFSEYGDAPASTLVNLSARTGENGSVEIDAEPTVGAVAAAENVEGPYVRVPDGRPPISVLAGEDRRFFKTIPRSLPGEYGRIEGTVVDAQGAAITNVFVEVEEFSFSQLTGERGEFRFRLLPPGEHRLKFHRLVEVVHPVTGERNETEISVSVPVLVTANTGIVVTAKLDLPSSIDALGSPPCACSPWSGIICATVDGVSVIAAVGGKIGLCADDASHVTITGPGGVNVTNPREGRRTFRNTNPGVWAITATVCSKTKQAQITLP